jgi:hypothetical protein
MAPLGARVARELTFDFVVTLHRSLGKLTRFPSCSPLTKSCPDAEAEPTAPTPITPFFIGALPAFTTGPRFPWPFRPPIRDGLRNT